MVVDVDQEAAFQSEQTGALEAVALQDDGCCRGTCRRGRMLNAVEARQVGVESGNWVAEDDVDRVPQLVE